MIPTPSPTWDPDVDETAAVVTPPRMPLADPAELNDGRCIASSWRAAVPRRRPHYESWYGPGGYNRCVGHADHANPLHKDEWGHVFRVDPDGTNFRVIRMESTS